jgi:hypothetical protein
MEREDKILKSFFNYVEGIKDVVNKNLVSSVNEKLISIDPSTLSALANLINASVDEAFHRGQSSLLREITGVFATESKPKPTTSSSKKN